MQAVLALWTSVGCSPRPPASGTAPWPSAAPDLAAADVDRDCRTNAFTNSVLAELAAGNGRSPFAAWTGHAIERRLHDWEGVAWRGLTLTGIGSLHGIESGPSDFSLYFREAPATVLSRLNAHGYDLPAAGQERGIDGALSIGVHADGEGTALTCSFD
jgi:hypothetical protein